MPAKNWSRRPCSDIYGKKADMLILIGVEAVTDIGAATPAHLWQCWRWTDCRLKFGDCWKMRMCVLQEELSWLEIITHCNLRCCELYSTATAFCSLIVLWRFENWSSANMYAGRWSEIQKWALMQHLFSNHPEKTSKKCKGKEWVTRLTFFDRLAREEIGVVFCLLKRELMIFQLCCLNFVWMFWF